MSKKDEFELTREEMELIQLRRIRAEEAQKRNKSEAQHNSSNSSGNNKRSKSHNSDAIHGDRRSKQKTRSGRDNSNDERSKRRRPERENEIEGRSRNKASSKKRREEKKRAMKKKKRKKILLTILGIIAAAIIALVLVFMYVPGAKTAFAQFALSTPVGKSIVASIIGDDYEEYVQNTDWDEDDITINSGVDISDEYTNIALFGIDARGSEFDSSTRTDTIIILSINNDTGEIKMASIYRDTYLKMVDDDGDVSYTKANAAYAYGGAEEAINMLNENFDLNITDYIVVNFAGISNIVDELGGLELDIDENEIEYINYYLTNTENVTDIDGEEVTESGLQTLSGVQVTSYCRIRYTPFEDKDTGDLIYDDYGRTARQRYVLTTLLETAADSGLSTLLDASTAIFEENTGDDKFIESSLDTDELVEVMAACLELNIGDTEGFPAEKGSYSSCVVPADLAYNAELLHEFLFDDDDYEVSSDLQEISDYITSVTGVYSAE